LAAQAGAPKEVAVVKEAEAEGEEADAEESTQDQSANDLVLDELIGIREADDSVREITYKLRKEMNDKTMQMFLRTTICFKDIGRFEGKDKSLLYSDEYTGNHIAIFECELKAPPQIALIDHTYTQFLDSYRMNFRNWKIVDIDNWMEGNHFFSELQEEKVWESKVDAVFKDTKTKTVYLQQDKIDQPNYHEEHLLPFIRAKNE
jgi:hypothetical protein